MITPVKSRCIGGPEVFIQLVNVPQIRGVENDIRTIFTNYGVVTEPEPIIYVDTEDKWTRRWNLILNIPEGTVLVMHPLITILGCKVAAFWQGSRMFTWNNYYTECMGDKARKTSKDETMTVAVSSCI